MAVTDTIQRQDNRSWLIQWTTSLGAAAICYFYINGLLAWSGLQRFFQLEAVEGEQKQYEILDDIAGVPEPGYPGRAFLTWLPQDDVASYKIQELVDAVWTTRATIADSGQTWFSWTSRYLEDSTTHQFRIVPRGTNGSDGLPRPFTFFMIRRPDLPAAIATYNAVDGGVTFTAAA